MSSKTFFRFIKHFAVIPGFRCIQNFDTLCLWMLKKLFAWCVYIRSYKQRDLRSGNALFASLFILFHLWFRFSSKTSFQAYEKSAFFSFSIPHSSFVTHPLIPQKTKNQREGKNCTGRKTERSGCWNLTFLKRSNFIFFSTNLQKFVLEDHDHFEKIFYIFFLKTRKLSELLVSGYRRAEIRQIWKLKFETTINLKYLDFILKKWRENWKNYRDNRKSWQLVNTEGVKRQKKFSSTSSLELIQPGPQRSEGF